MSCVTSNTTIESRNQLYNEFSTGNAEANSSPGVLIVDWAVPIVGFNLHRTCHRALVIDEPPAQKEWGELRLCLSHATQSRSVSIYQLDSSEGLGRPDPVDYESSSSCNSNITPSPPPDASTNLGPQLVDIADILSSSSFWDTWFGSRL